jgi:hypothetical protein
MVQEDPPSVNEIASSLGYKSSGAIRARFPELCGAIVAQRRQQVQQKKQRMRLALEKARAETPPPSLIQIGRWLGYTAEVVLVQTFPHLCNSYSSGERLGPKNIWTKLRLLIREWLSAEAAPTIASACPHFGVSATYLQVNFPAENAEVVRRSAECARKAREAHAVAQREEVFKIVIELLQSGLYPSLPRVRSALGPNMRRRWSLLRPAIDDALSRLGPVLRRRNELGRFV